jgi:hypothetical protein
MRTRPAAAERAAHRARDSAAAGAASALGLCTDAGSSATHGQRDAQGAARARAAVAQAERSWADSVRIEYQAAQRAAWQSQTHPSLPGHSCVEVAIGVREVQRADHVRMEQARTPLRARYHLHQHAPGSIRPESTQGALSLGEATGTGTVRCLHLVRGNAKEFDRPPETIPAGPCGSACVTLWQAAPTLPGCICADTKRSRQADERRWHGMVV